MIRKTKQLYQALPSSPVSFQGRTTVSGVPALNLTVRFLPADSIFAGELSRSRCRAPFGRYPAICLFAIQRNPSLRRTLLLEFVHQHGRLSALQPVFHRRALPVHFPQIRHGLGQYRSVEPADRSAESTQPLNRTRFRYNVSRKCGSLCHRSRRGLCRRRVPKTIVLLREQRLQV